MLSGFAHLRSVAVHGLPCEVTVELLQPLVHDLKKLQYIDIKGSSSQHQADLQGSAVVQQWLQRSVPWAQVHI